MRKKKSFVFLFILTIMIELSFSKIYNVNADIIGESESIDEVTRGMGVEMEQNLLEKLYYGYDVTSGINLMNGDALKAAHPIIEENSDYKKYIKVIPTRTVPEMNSIIKSSSKAVSEEYTKSFSGDLLGKIFVVDMDVSGSFTSNNRVKNVCSERYELYKICIEEVRYIAQKLDVDDIKQFLSEDFKSELYSVSSKESAKNLFKRYGTHLITGYIYGGRMNIANYMATNDSGTDLMTEKTMQNKMDVYMEKVRASEKVSFQEEVLSSENDSSIESTYDLKVYGGKEGVAASLNDMFTYNDGLNADTDRFMYQRWADSIDRHENLVIVGIPDNNNAMCIPIWEFLDYTDNRSFSIRDYLVEVYMELCGDKYDEYQKQFSSGSNYITHNVSRESLFPICNGAYIQTKSNYFYYVEAKDFLRDGEHYGIRSGDTIHLDLESLFEDGISIETQNCEEVDKRAGIYKVKNVSGSVIIKAKKANGDCYEYVNIPIINNSDFEGGMGTGKYPYMISSTLHFGNIVKNPSAHYVLLSDLDFGRGELTSLGTFSGTLDGNYCSIGNFTIQGNRDWGLCSLITEEGTVKNLYIKNAGTSVSESKFSGGGVDYANDYKSNMYQINSIQAVNAGIICGVNRGRIENCYVQNSFIRDIFKDNPQYETNSQITVCVGGIAGQNYGTIVDSMTKDVKIFGSYINTKDRDLGTSVFCGGITGELCENGIIQGCVCDFDMIGFVGSQIICEYTSLFTADYEAHSYAAGLIGFCNSTATIKNSYSYVRNSNSTSALYAEYRSTDATCKPKVYHALRNATLICGNNSNISFINDFAYSADTGILVNSIMPADNNDEVDDTDGYVFVDQSFIEKAINQKTDFEGIHLSESSYEFSYSNKQPEHLLQKDRNYIKLYLDKSSGKEMNVEVYQGRRLSLKNINLIKSINSKIDVQEKFFRVKIIDTKDNQKDVINQPLGGNDNKRYKIVLSSYGDIIVASDELYVNIIDKNVKGISITEKNNDDYQIYYDEIDKYVSDWSPSQISVKKIMSDGSFADFKSSEKENIRICTSADELHVGENNVTVEYWNGEVMLSAQYLLKIVDRELISVSIDTENAVKREYVSGEILV